LEGVWNIQIVEHKQPGRFRFGEPLFNVSDGGIRIREQCFVWHHFSRQALEIQMDRLFRRAANPVDAFKRSVECESSAEFKSSLGLSLAAHTVEYGGAAVARAAGVERSLEITEDPLAANEVSDTRRRYVKRRKAQ
jgi:hypothetical protein